MHPAAVRRIPSTVKRRTNAPPAEPICQPGNDIVSEPVVLARSSYLICFERLTESGVKPWQDRRSHPIASGRQDESENLLAVSWDGVDYGLKSTPECCWLKKSNVMGVLGGTPKLVKPHDGGDTFWLSSLGQKGLEWTQ